MSDFARDMVPDHCVLCEGPIVGEQKWRCVDGELVHTGCWLDKTQLDMNSMQLNEQGAKP